MGKINNYANPGKIIAREDRRAEIGGVDNLQGRRSKARRRLNFDIPGQELASREQTERITDEFLNALTNRYAQPETIQERYNVIGMVHPVQATMDEITTTANAAGQYFLHPDF